MATSTARIMQALRAAIVPPLCVCCREPQLSDRSLCRECAFELKPAVGGAAGVWSAFEYEGVARELVHSLKSKANLAAATAMASAMVELDPPIPAQAQLVPVPAHAARQRRHGFNHARELTRALARELGLEVADVLERRHSERQTGKRRVDRIAAARNSMVARPRAAELAAAVLVDDVYTTGATVDACATALRVAGAGPVSAISFARTR